MHGVLGVVIQELDKTRRRDPVCMRALAPECHRSRVKPGGGWHGGPRRSRSSGRRRCLRQGTCGLAPAARPGSRPDDARRGTRSSSAALQASTMHEAHAPRRGMDGGCGG